MNTYKDIWYTSDDGLKLYARDYHSCGNDCHGTLFCIHGLTRNAADFEDFCEYFADRYRIVVVDQRGRGNSQWDDNPTNYEPAVYVRDMYSLIKCLSLNNLIFVGTSLGGLISMVMTATTPDLVRAAIINDVGPKLNPVGLERIKAYVGKTKPVTNWDEAIDTTAELNGAVFPKADRKFWLRFAKKIYRENEKGVPVLAYDPALSAPIKSGGQIPVPPDLWSLFQALIPLPLLLVRGELSDVISTDCVREMLNKKPDMKLVTVPEVGHAPILDEPEVISAINQFLAELES